MLVFAKGVTALNRVLFTCAKWLVLLIAALMIYEVVSRYSFHAPTSWAPELATLIFGPFFLLGGPYLLHLGGHVAVDLLSAKAGPRMAKTLSLVGLILAIVFGAILLWFAFPLALQSFEYRETSYSTWNPPVWPAKAVLPLASALLIVQALAEIAMLFFGSE